MINFELFITKNIIKKNKIFIKFVFFGTIATGINLLVFFFLSKTIQNIFFMTTIYWIFGLNLKFFIYKIFVFNDYKYVNLVNKILKHYVFYTIFFLVNYFYLDFFSKNYSLDLVFFQISFVIFGIPISYLFLKNQVFKK